MAFMIISMARYCATQICATCPSHALPHWAKRPISHQLSISQRQHFTALFINGHAMICDRKQHQEVLSISIGCRLSRWTKSSKRNKFWKICATFREKMRLIIATMGLLLEVPTYKRVFRTMIWLCVFTWEQ